MEVAGSELLVHAEDFHLLVGVLDAQVGETDLPINNEKVQLACCVVIRLRGVHKARVDGLSIVYEAVASNQAFAFLGQSEDLPGSLSWLSPASLPSV